MHKSVSHPTATSTLGIETRPALIGPVTLLQLVLDVLSPRQLWVNPDCGLKTRAWPETIGRSLKLPVVSKSPEEAAEHFGWLAHFVAADIPSSSAQTQQRLNCHPKGPSLISDLNQMQY